MAERLDFYRCELCGTIIQVMHRGEGELVCCGHPMTYLQAHTPDEEKREKHVPVVMDNKIQVGSELHPMMSEHHIDFIESVSDDRKRVEIKFLEVTDCPDMEISERTKPSEMYEYCNLHGLWKGTN
jgi:superoxide reductase